MPAIELLTVENYTRIPWKNGRGELIVIAREGGDSWENMGVAWHLGRTAIVEEGPFSDYGGYERLQVVVAGAGLVLVAPDHEIDLRAPMRPQRYDGGIPIRTRLEKGPVEVVNLIANRARFDIDLRVGAPSAALPCAAGSHVVYAPSGAARIDVGGDAHRLEAGNALRARTASEIMITVLSGDVVVGSVHDKP